MPIEEEEEVEDEVTGEWRKLLKEELNDLYSSFDLVIIRANKLRIMRQAGHVACMGNRTGA